MMKPIKQTVNNIMCILIDIERMTCKKFPTYWN